jgi:hypothetical protein
MNAKMTLAKLAKQISAMACSEFDEGAKVLWIYLLAVKRGGVGFPALKERLHLFDIDESIATLEEEGLIHKRGGRYVPRLYDLRGTTPTDIVLSADSEIEITKMVEEYNFARMAAQQLPLPRADRRRMKQIYSFMVEQGVSFQDYLDHCLVIWRAWSDRPLPFPLPEHLAGAYLMNKYVAGLTTERQPGQNTHAGFSYGGEMNKSQVTLLLRRGGYGRWLDNANDDMIRHVFETAQDLVDAPDLDISLGEHADVIMFLVEKIKGS